MLGVRHVSNRQGQVSAAMDEYISQDIWQADVVWLNNMAEIHVLGIRHRLPPGSEAL